MSNTKPNRKPLKFTHYSSNTFEVTNAKPIIEKFVAHVESQRKKQTSKKRIPTTTGLIKVPKQAHAPEPIPVGDLAWRNVVQQYDSEVLDRYYRDRVVREYCAQAAKILYERLEPGYNKFGYWKPLGSCKAEYFTTFLSHQPQCQTWDPNFKEKHDGRWIKKTRTIYYFPTQLPDLWVDYPWYIRYHGDGISSHESRSFYTQLAFIINPDGRVFYHYSQITQAKCPFRGWINVC